MWACPLIRQVVLVSRLHRGNDVRVEPESFLVKTIAEARETLRHHDLDRARRLASGKMSAKQHRTAVNSFTKALPCEALTASFRHFTFGFALPFRVNAEEK